MGGPGVISSPFDQAFLISEIIAVLRRWENGIPWMYRDSAPAGNCTVGLGMLLADASSAAALPFLDPSGLFAYDEDIRADFARVMAMPLGMAARFYRSPTSVELSDASITMLAEHRLTEEFLPGLLRLLPGYARFPIAVQLALADLAWNLGLGAQASSTHEATGLCGFPRLLAACSRADWGNAAVECHRMGCSVERNEWTKARFLLARDSDRA